MGSKGRIPPPHLRNPLPAPGIGRPDPFASGIHPPHGAFNHLDMLPPPEVMEQKLAAQHVEIQKLAIENQRFIATHGTLRQHLAAIQHELQMAHNHVGAVKSESEQQIMGLVDKIRKMETELQGAEPLKLELQQARADATSLVSSREELVSRVQQLTEDNQRAHMDLQQIPSLISELESLRQEYQHCRATYEYEKKLYNDHLDTLQVMEKNYMTMATEMEKLRAELTKYADTDRRTGGPYGGFAGYNEKEASGHYSVGQNTYDDAYGVSQGRGPLPGVGDIDAAVDGNTPAGSQAGPMPVRVGYEAQKGPLGPGYDVQRGHAGSDYDLHKGAGGPTYDSQRGSGGSYDAQRGVSGPGYDAQRGTGYDSQRGYAGHGYDPYRGPSGPGYDPYRGSSGSAYDAQRGHGYEVPRGAMDAQRGPGYDVQRGATDAQRGPGYDVQRGATDTQRGPGFDGQHRGPGFDSPKGAGYDAPSRGATGPQGQVAQANNLAYGSATPPARAASGFQVPPPGGNPARR